MPNDPTPRRHRGPRSTRLILLALATLAGGCRLSYNAPPTRVGQDGPVYRDPSMQRHVILGHFENPENSPIGWENVGKGMTQVLERVLLNHGTFDVIIDPNFAKQVMLLRNQSPGDRAVAMQKLRTEYGYQHVRYVVVGKVTDFTHTRDKPKEVRRRVLFWDLRDAVVAFKMDVIDIDGGYVVSSDHLHGQVRDRSSTKREKLYEEGLAFDSYLFWTSPLGQASEEAATKATKILDQLIPTEDSEAWLVNLDVDPAPENDSSLEVTHASGRIVRVAAGPGVVLRKGDRYQIKLPNPQTGKLEVVRDSSPYAYPLEIELMSTSRLSARGFVTGETDRDLLGARLELNRGGKDKGETGTTGDSHSQPR